MRGIAQRRRPRVWPTRAGDHGAVPGGVPPAPHAPPSASWRTCAASRWGGGRWPLWSQRRSGRSPSRWPRHGPMSRRSPPRLWMKRGGAQGGSGPGCRGATTTWVTVCVVRRSRRAEGGSGGGGGAVLGWVVTERWSAYPWYPTWRRQLWWAHLWRDMEAMIERGGRAAEIGEALRAQARQMFHGEHRLVNFAQGYMRMYHR